MLAWGFWPPRQTTHLLEIDPEQMGVPGDESSAVRDARRLSLVTPVWLRLGDSAKARLTFEPLPAQAIPAGKRDAALNYDVYVETRLDFPGLSVDPPGSSGQILPAGRTVVCWWQLTALRAGSIEGTAWLSLRFEPHQSGNAIIQALAAPRVRVQVRHLLGLSGAAARWVGSLLALVGAAGFIWRWKSA